MENRREIKLYGSRAKGRYMFGGNPAYRAHGIIIYIVCVLYRTATVSLRRHNNARRKHRVRGDDLSTRPWTRARLLLSCTPSSSRKRTHKTTMMRQHYKL